MESLEGIFGGGPTPARRWHELGTRGRRDLIKIWRGSCLCKLPTSCSCHKANGECDGLPWSPRVIDGIGKASRRSVRSRELSWMVPRSIPTVPKHLHGWGRNALGVIPNNVRLLTSHNGNELVSTTQPTQ